MNRKFRIVVKQGTKTVAEIEGREGVADKITIGELAEKTVETEAFLERITGLRFHINLEQ